ncbi:MAG: hypothetical protein Q8Q09_03240 [Deltaproteobacteria bacterium]|nr:hypothetical protein [Deltaproteobacteria bacterium]
MTHATASTDQDPIRVIAKLEPKLNALDPNKLHPGNLDVAQAASLVIGHYPGIAKYRDELQATIRDFDVGNLDDLARYAIAAKYLVTIEQNRRNQVDPVASKELEAGRALRARLATVARMFADLGVFDDATVRDIERISRGYEGTSSALLRLSELFRTKRELVEGNMPMRFEELDEARTTAIAIGAAGARPENKTPEEIADKRRRAVTLFMNAYDEVRYALQYLRRHHQDAHEIVPKLTNRVGTSRSDSASSPREELSPDKRDELAKAEERARDSDPAREPLGLSEPLSAAPALPDSPFRK